MRKNEIIWELLDLLRFDGWTDEDLYTQLTSLESTLGDLTEEEIALLWGEFPPKKAGEEKKHQKRKNEKLSIFDSIAESFADVAYGEILGAYPVPEEHIVLYLAAALKQEVKELWQYSKKNGERVSKEELASFQKCVLMALIDAYADFKGVSDMETVKSRKNEIYAFLAHIPDSNSDRAKEFRNLFPQRINRSEDKAIESEDPDPVVDDTKSK